MRYVEGSDLRSLLKREGKLTPERPLVILAQVADARADCYALACVMYQCLAGASPSRRATEAETLWAHVQQEPPPLPDHPDLDPVLRKGLVKDREDRYGDTTLNTIAVYRIEDGRLRFETRITPPAELLARR
jgi:hypothetical protein